MSKTILNYCDRSNQVSTVTKIRCANNVTNGTNAIYDENET